MSLSDGFALATAISRSASAVTFDERVRRAMQQVGVELPEPLAE